MEPSQADSSQEESVRKLILGLGNPGAEYRATRHNYGFFVIDELARRWGVSLHQDLCGADFAEATYEGHPVDLAQPRTYMNRSGLAVRCLVERFGYALANILIVYDEVALPLGRRRLRPKGSPAGHRGMESVVSALRSVEVARLRLGIAPDEDDSGAAFDLSGFVLSEFDDKEKNIVENEVETAADACQLWVLEGAAATMTRYNG